MWQRHVFGDDGGVDAALVLALDCPWLIQRRFVSAFCVGGGLFFVVVFFAAVFVSKLLRGFIR